jgi:hypothetical protein
MHDPTTMATTRYARYPLRGDQPAEEMAVSTDAARVMVLGGPEAPFRPGSTLVLDIDPNSGGPVRVRVAIEPGGLTALGEYAAAPLRESGRRSDHRRRFDRIGIIAGVAAAALLAGVLIGSRSASHHVVPATPALATSVTSPALIELPPWVDLSRLSR